MRVRGLVLATGMLMMVGCAGHKQPAGADLFNDVAMVKGTLPYPVMEWKPLTVTVDRGGGTMATLFGNDAAVAAARDGQSYASGAVLGLVTWGQREDPHWFGARLPGRPVSVEFVEFGAGGMPVYRKFVGSPMRESNGGDAVRMMEIAGMKAVQLP